MKVGELIEKLNSLALDKDVGIYYDTLAGSYDLQEYMIVDTENEIMLICCQDDEIDYIVENYL